MKKTAVVLCSVIALLLGACQNIFTPTVAPGPTVDSAATANSQFNTAVAQTLTAQPPVTVVPVTNTATAVVPVASPTLPPSATGPAVTSTATPVVDLTNTGATATVNIPTATNLPPNGTPTATLVAGQVTAIWTLAIREYGTLPPAVPFSQVTLVNKANTEAYISLQVTMPDGKYSIIEYPVEGRVKIQAPVGSYLYVAWVGGRKMVGNFKLSHDDDLTITLYRDKIEVK